MNIHTSKEYGIFERNQNLLYKHGEAITWHYLVLTPYTVSKDEWGIKEGTGKSMKHLLYVLRYAQGTFWAEVTLNSEKIKPVALAVIELLLKIMCSNLLEAFQVVLKALFGLVIPNQYYQGAMKMLCGWIAL